MRVKKILFVPVVSSYQSYYGGEARCIEQAGLSDEFDPSELVCGGCSDVAQAQVVYIKSH